MNEIATVKYGGFWRRVAAGLIDGLVFCPITIVTFWLMKQPIQLYLVANLPVVLLLTALTVFFLGRYGATPGKMVMRLQVRDVNGGAITYKQALCRNIVILAMVITQQCLVYLNTLRLPAETTMTSLTMGSQISLALQLVMYASIAWFYIDVLFLLFNKKKRAVHDFIAQTVVIRKFPNPVVV